MLYVIAVGEGVPFSRSEGMFAGTDEVLENRGEARRVAMKGIEFSPRAGDPWRGRGDPQPMQVMFRLWGYGHGNG